MSRKGNRKSVQEVAGRCSTRRAAANALIAGESANLIAPSNNGMHPTANSVAFIRKTCFNSTSRRGG